MRYPLPDTLSDWVAQNVEQEDDDDMSPVAPRKVTVRLQIGAYAALSLLASVAKKSATGAATELLTIAVYEAAEKAGIHKQAIEQEIDELIL